MEDKILESLVRLERKVSTLTAKVDTLSRQVAQHETKLKWVTTAALVVVSVVGGPNAAQVLTQVGGGG